MRIFLLLALSFHAPAHAATFEYNADDDQFIYRDQVLPLNEDEHRFLRVRAEQSAPVPVLDFAIPMRWMAFHAKSNALRMMQQIDHRALVYNGALLLKHEGDLIDFVEFRSSPPTPDKSETIDTRRGQITLDGHAARIARILEAQFGAPALERLSITEADFIKIGLPLQNYRQELAKLNQASPGPEPLVAKFSVHLRRTDYESKWDQKTNAFTPIKPDPPHNDCKENL